MNIPARPWGRLRPTRTPRNNASRRKARLRIAALFVMTLIAGVAGYASLHTSLSHAYGAGAFVMVVKTDNPGTSNSTSFSIPTTGAGYSYNVDCNDDGVNEVTARTTAYTCVYGAAGTYTVAITGTFPRVYFNNGGDRQKLLEVKQWGTGVWTSMASAFRGCNNLHVTATDAPNLTVATDMSRMFEFAINMNENINHWDVSHITNMSYLFNDDWNQRLAFNQPLNNWNTSAVTNMSYMFQGAAAFNQSIGTWDTGNVTNMSWMFNQASTFNQPIGGWNTSKLTNASFMFNYALAFNQPINNWNTDALQSIVGILQGARSFNQPLNGWNTSVVTDMRQAFSDATAFNQPLDSWNTSAVTNMSWMFSGANAFNQPLSGWNTSAVTDMSRMFSGANAFNQPLSGWNTSAVTDMSYMFSGADAFNQPLSGWNTSAVTDMSQMFSDASTFNQPLTSFNTSAVTNMNGMFSDAHAFNRPLTSFNTSAVTNMSRMFSGASAFNQPLTNFNTSAVTNMSQMFSYTSAFNQPLESWNTAAVTNMSQMFSGASAFNQPLTNFNTSAVTNMSGMFDYSGLSQTNYDQFLATIASQTLQPGVTLGAAGVMYCDDVARAALITAPNNWTITDGGYCNPIVTTPGNLTVTSLSSPVVSGTAAPNRTIHIDIDGNTHTTTADGSGAFSFTWPIALVDGWHSAAVRSTDSDGSPGVATFVAFNVHSGGDITMSGSPSQPTLSWSEAPGVVASTTWDETAQGASSFPARGGFGTAVLNGKLWVAGGQGASGRLKDVWSSPDGVSWTQVLANAPWAARSSHTLTAFNGKLWIMGGRTTNHVNDIWSSPDGVTWTQETASAAWSPRSGHRVVEYNNKLWIMGGVGSSGGLNDVWNSTDGVNWTLVTGASGWSARNGFGATAFDGKLWVMGGANGGSGPFTNDVWSSTDGVAWTEETANAAWPVRASLQVQAFDGKMWVLGGSAADWDSEYSDVWFSENGKDWMRTTDAAAWTARRGHSSAVFNNKLWVLGGNVGTNWTISNDVWRADAPPVTYTVCWDTTNGGCAHTATTNDTQTYTIPTNLTPGTWYFKVQATGPQGQSLGSFTASSYTVTDPTPVTTPLSGKPVVHPTTGAPSTATLPAALTGATLSVASYDCSDLQTASVRLVEPDGLKVPESGVTLLGGVGFRVGCTSNGKSTDVALTLGTAYRDTSKLRAYKQSGTNLMDITDQVTFTNKDVGGTTKTVASYNLVDGGSLDEDGVANGTLVDPIFVGVVDGTRGELANTGMSIWTQVAAGATAVVTGAVVLSLVAHRRARRIRATRF